MGIDSGIRKRNKPTFVCTNCKKRKTKCDRKIPCSSCVKTNSGFSCTYESNWRPVSFLELKRRPSGEVMGQMKQSLIAEVTEVPITNVTNSGISSNGSSSDPNQNPFDELTVLRKKLNDLEASLKSQAPTSSPEGNISSVDSDIINFYEGFSPSQPTSIYTTENYGPLSYMSIIKRDPWLCMLWRYFDSKLYPSEVINEFDGTNDIKEEVNEKFEKRAFNQSCYLNHTAKSVNFGRSASTSHSNLSKSESLDTNINQGDNTNMTGSERLDSDFNIGGPAHAKSWYDGKFDSSMQLNSRILKALPKKRVIWTLIDKFFSNIYPFFPFLDEVQFKEDLSKLIGPISYEDSFLETIEIKKRTDLANIAICMFLLRLAHLSLFSNKVLVNESIVQAGDSKESYLISNPIGLVTIDAARLCLQYVQISKAANFTVFQALLYHRIYSSYAPEEGEIVDVGESQVACDSLVRMAYSLGLHREPDKFDDCRNDEKANHLGRKIWYYLVRLEVIHCYNVGSLPSIDYGHFDVKAPFVTEKNHNCPNTVLEQYITDSFEFYRPRLCPLRNILSMILDINNGCSVKRLVVEMGELEEVCAQFFNVLRLSSNPEIIPSNFNQDQYVNIVKAKIFLMVKCALITLYFHLYLHYEKKSNFELSYYYLLKIYRTIYDDFLPYIFEVLHGKYSNHGIFLNTLIQVVMHKSNQTFLSNLTRVNYLKYSMEAKLDHKNRLLKESQYRDYHKRIVSLSNNIGKSGALIITLFKRYSSTYYYAWKIAKSHSAVFESLGGDGLYKSPIPSLKKLHSFQYTEGQLDELNDLTYSLGKGLEHIVNFDQGYAQANIKREPALNFSGIGNESVKTMSGENPGSFKETPPFLLNQDSNNYIDQMWTQMMGMKEPIKPDSTATEPLAKSYNELANNTRLGDIDHIGSASLPLEVSYFNGNGHPPQPPPPNGPMSSSIQMAQGGHGPQQGTGQHAIQPGVNSGIPIPATGPIRASNLNPNPNTNLYFNFNFNNAGAINQEATNSSSLPATNLQHPQVSAPLSHSLPLAHQYTQLNQMSAQYPNHIPHNFSINNFNNNFNNVNHTIHNDMNNMNNSSVANINASETNVQNGMNPPYQFDIAPPYPDDSVQSQGYYTSDLELVNSYNLDQLLR